MFYKSSHLFYKFQKYVFGYIHYSYSDKRARFTHAPKQHDYLKKIIILLIQIEFIKKRMYLNIRSEIFFSARIYSVLFIEKIYFNWDIFSPELKFESIFPIRSIDVSTFGLFMQKKHAKYIHRTERQTISGFFPFKRSTLPHFHILPLIHSRQMENRWRA